MTRPWHRRRLRVARTERRTSSAARMRAHLLALGAWEGALAGASEWLACAVHPSTFPRAAATCIRRSAEWGAWAIGWAAAARRWA
jgi:hypothetical protein